MSFQNKMGEELKNLVESRGVDGACAVIKESLDSKKMTPENYSIREMWEACEGTKDATEAVSSNAFPKLTGELIGSKLIGAYDSVAIIGEQLTQTVSSNVQNPTVAGITDAEGPEETGEGQEIPSSTVAEKYVTGQNKKYTRRVDITEETIMFDKTNEILQRTRRIGMKAAQFKEKLIIEGIQDTGTDVYRPTNVPTAFYSTANGNYKTSNPFGEAGLEAIMVLASKMKDDSLGKTNNDFIQISPLDTFVLIPMNLQVEAWQMANSMLTPESAENAANFFKGRFQVVSSPYVGQQSTTTWYWGDFKEDFWWNEVYPLRVIQSRPGSDAEFYKEIKVSHKIGLYGSIMAVSAKHSFKSVD